MVTLRHSDPRTSEERVLSHLSRTLQDKGLVVIIRKLMGIVCLLNEHSEALGDLSSITEYSRSLLVMSDADISHDPVD
jgi:hypothetical protein